MVERCDHWDDMDQHCCETCGNEGQVHGGTIGFGEKAAVWFEGKEREGFISPPLNTATMVIDDKELLCGSVSRESEFDDYDFKPSTACINYPKLMTVERKLDKAHGEV